MMRHFLALLVVCSSCVGATAHDWWGNGQEVDPKTKGLCCGKSDCKQIDIGQVHQGANGVHLDTTGEDLPYSRVQPSPDGHYWQCSRPGHTYCYFQPMGSS